MIGRAAIEVIGKCPYCDYAWSVECADVRGELNALRCVDCAEIFVVEVAVEVNASVHTLQGVESGAVMDRLIAEKLTSTTGDHQQSTDDNHQSPPRDEPEPPGKPQHSAPAKASNGVDSPPAKVQQREPRRMAGFDDDRRRKLSYDDRTRIRTRYQAGLEAAVIEGRAKLPRGFVKALAEEFGVSENTVITIGRNRDSF